METTKHNYYIGKYRIVHINMKWRVCIQDSYYLRWNFINDIEYNTVGEAIDSINV